MRKQSISSIFFPTDRASPQSRSTAGLPLPSSSSESKLAFGAEPHFNKQQRLREGELSSSCGGPVTQLLCPETLLPFPNKTEISSPISFESTLGCTGTGLAKPLQQASWRDRATTPATMTMPPPLPPRHNSHAKAPRALGRSAVTPAILGAGVGFLQRGHMHRTNAHHPMATKQTSLLGCCTPWVDLSWRPRAAGNA